MARYGSHSGDLAVEGLQEDWRQPEAPGGQAERRGGHGASGVGHSVDQDARALRTH